MAAFMTLLLAMQFVVSVRAGLVNDVQGTANVAPMSMARVDRPIITGADGYVEVLLTPGAFLRLGESSEVVLEGVELSDVRLRVVKGPAVIEVVEISKHTPITVTTGNLTTKVTQGGIFRFEEGVATVLHGKLQTADEKLAYEKGWQIFYQDNYRARKSSNIELTSLDVYSDSRSSRIARANMTLASVVRSPMTYDYWLFSPDFGYYTYIPQSNYKSPYGYRYYGGGQASAPRYTNNTSSGGGGGTPPAPRSTTTSTSSSSDSGAAAAAPAVTVTAPSGERSSPAVYIESKNTPAGATQ